MHTADLISIHAAVLIHPFIQSSLYPVIQESLYPFIQPSVHQFIQPSVYKFIQPSLYPIHSTSRPYINSSSRPYIHSVLYLAHPSEVNYPSGLFAVYVCTVSLARVGNEIIQIHTNSNFSKRVSRWIRIKGPDQGVFSLLGFLIR